MHRVFEKALPLAATFWIALGTGTQQATIK